MDGTPTPAATAIGGKKQQTGPTRPAITSAGWRRRRAKSRAVRSMPTAASRSTVSIGTLMSMSACTVHRLSVNWSPAWRESPGRPPMAGCGELKVPVM